MSYTIIFSLFPQSRRRLCEVYFDNKLEIILSSSITGCSGSRVWTKNLMFHQLLIIKNLVTDDEEKDIRYICYRRTYIIQQQIVAVITNVRWNLRKNIAFSILHKQAWFYIKRNCKEFSQTTVYFKWRHHIRKQAKHKDSINCERQILSYFFRKEIVKTTYPYKCYHFKQHWITKN